MKPRLAPLLLLLSYAACTSVQTLPVQSERTYTRSYELGQTQEVTTGSTMLRVARALIMPTFTPEQIINSPFYTRHRQPKRKHQSRPIQPGERWVVSSRFRGGGYVITNAERTALDNTPSIHLRPDGSVSGWVDVGSQEAWPDGARFVRHDVPEIVEGSFEAELIYSGKSGDTIKLVYREYLDGLARPAFTQALEYDLSESKTIAFKTLVIDVLEATNSSIRFVVQSDGGLPWLG